MSSERDPVWDAMKEHSKAKFKADRDTFLSKAQERDDGQWVKHTEFHWSRIVAGERLDYWPSRSKFQFKGKVHRGDVHAFIRKQEPQ